MPEPQIEFTEGPPPPPPDASSTVAVIAYCSGAAPSGDPNTPTVFAFDSAGPVQGAAGRGIGAVVSHWLASKGKKRVLLAPCNASVAGVCSAVTQTGNGPLVTASGTPIDDASVIARIKDAGPSGTGTFEISWSSVVKNGNASPLYQAAKTIPPRTKATAIGSVDLSTLAYAKAATVTGTVDLSGFTYGAGGTLDTLTLIADFDNAGGVTTTFSAPANAAQVASQINDAVGDDVATINQQGKLVLTSVSLGADSEVDITGGTGRATLGLSVHTYAGTAGDLDGGTLILDEDTTSPQTVTFTPPPANPAAAAAAVAAKTNIDADIYTTKNLLRVQSSTVGSASRLNITGGTKRATLGLAIPSAPYEGAESTYEIEHLGVTLTFGSGSSSDFKAGTTYALTCKAPKPDATEINNRIADLLKAGYAFGRILIPTTADIGTLLAQATSLDTKLGEFEGQQEYVSCAILGADITEADADVKSTFAAFRSRRVDGCAGGAYLSTDLVPGGGDTLRSVSWLAAYTNAAYPLGADRGDHGQPVLPCSGVTRNEALATTKLVTPVNAAGNSWNVIDGKPGRFFFAGGYTFADGTSAYCNQATRDVIVRAAQIAASALTFFQNSTQLSVTGTGTLDDVSSDRVDAAVTNDLLAELVPSAAQNARSRVDKSIDFYTLKKLKAVITIHDRKPARIVTATIGPGIIEES